MTNDAMRILMVEDNPIDARLLEAILSKAELGDLQITQSATLADAFGLAEENRFDCILLDLFLPDSYGIETVTRMHRSAADLPIVVMTSLDDAGFGIQALQAGAQDYLVKGHIGARMLARSVRYAIERNRMQMEIRNLSLKDELTGLYNRRGFLALAEQQLKLAQRSARDLLLLFADVDGLKYINDTFGHREGDYAIKNSAEILRKTFRRSDIIARIGGDEFTVLAVDASLEDGQRMIAALEQNIEIHNEQSEDPYRLTLSMGLAAFEPSMTHSIEELMSRADAALYEQKRRKPARSVSSLAEAEIKQFSIV
jgi:diguanylate cyclase (GGDEF)-like protein